MQQKQDKVSKKTQDTAAEQSGFRTFWQKIKEMRRGIWYFVLLFIGAYALWPHRNTLLDFEKFDGIEIIFIVWIVLLIYPLFSELEFFGIKFKKEVEKVKDEVRNLTTELRLQSMEVKQNISSKANTYISISRDMPSKLELDATKNEIPTTAQVDVQSLDVPDDAVYIFKTRFYMESLVNTLCQKNNYDGSEVFYNKIQYLNRREIISGRIADAATQIYRIASRGVHGEIVSTEYMDFIREYSPIVFEEMKNTLKRNVRV